MTKFRNPIPVGKKILIGLFRHGSTSELRVAAQLFRVGISTVAGIQHQFMAAIIKYFGNKVHWPSTDEELLKVSQKISLVFGIIHFVLLPWMDVTSLVVQELLM